MDAYAKSKTPKGDGDKRQTPRKVFNRIQEILNVEFVFDVCAEKHTTKVPGQYWDELDDCLSIDWFKYFSDHVWNLNNALWMNPPYSNPAPFLEKACIESAKGLTIVGCLPDDRSTQWYQDYIEDKALIVYVPDKRISFEDANGVPQRGNPKGTIFPVWLPMKFDKTMYVRFKL